MHNANTPASADIARLHRITGRAGKCGLTAMSAVLGIPSDQRSVCPSGPSRRGPTTSACPQAVLLDIRPGFGKPCMHHTTA